MECRPGPHVAQGLPAAMNASKAAYLIDSTRGLRGTRSCDWCFASRVFTESFHEINGVALTSRQLDLYARQHELPMFSVRAGPETDSHQWFALHVRIETRACVDWLDYVGLTFDPFFARHLYGGSNRSYKIPSGSRAFHQPGRHRDSGRMAGAESTNSTGRFVAHQLYEFASSFSMQWNESKRPGFVTRISSSMPVPLFISFPPSIPPVRTRQRLKS